MDAASQKKSVRIQTLASTLQSGKLLLTVLKLISSVRLTIGFVQTEPPLEFSRKHCVGRECVLAYVTDEMSCAPFFFLHLHWVLFKKSTHKFGRLGQAYNFFFFTT